jgi:hypothetical protein
MQVEETGSRLSPQSPGAEYTTQTSMVMDRIKDNVVLDSDRVHEKPMRELWQARGIVARASRKVLQVDERFATGPGLHQDRSVIKTVGAHPVSSANRSRANGV